MSERSYHQYCPIAHALDLVGDRWALLIARDLLLGPRRYTDLRDALPGTGSNILTARLKALEGAGVIRRRTLPPPAASTVYELTPYGRGLEGVIVALGRWGVESLGAIQPGQIISPESVMLAGRALVAAFAPTLGTARAELRIADAVFSGVFGVRVADGEVVDVTREPADDVASPDLVVRTDVATLYDVAAGRISLHEAVAAGVVALEGTPAALPTVGDRADAAAHDCV
jgi:DNA-binding HxlR family transcriptional regulator